MHPHLAERSSPRAFDPTPLDPAVVTDLLEAARWAPSSMNNQPWRFVLAPRTDAEAHARLVATLVPGNQRWAPAAPLLVLVAAKTTYDNGKRNPHAWYDTGLGVAQLTLQATAHGLAVHQMGGVDRTAAHEAFGLPDDVEVVAVLAIGRRGDPDTLPDDLRERELAPRTRKPLDQIAFAGRWGVPAR